MSENSNRVSRSVQIADHLWELFEQMAKALGSDRDGLINQAMFVFARLNGFLEGGGRAGSPGASFLADTSSENGPILGGAAAGAGEPVEELSRFRDEASTARKYIGLEVAEAEVPSAGRAAVSQLFLTTADGRKERISKDRFVIGRGRHCDFVIDSGKVSREHAVIVREGAEHFIEDLKSSNGTWFNKQRISRRKIQDGDEYLICNDKIKLVLQ